LKNFATTNAIFLVRRKNENLLSFVKSPQMSIFSSRLPVFVISSVFRQNEIVWSLLIVITVSGIATAITHEPHVHLA